MENSGQFHSNEEEINTDAANVGYNVAVMSVLKAKMLELRATADERQSPSDIRPNGRVILNRHEAELSRLLIHRKLAKICLMSAGVRLLLRERTDISPIIISLLKQYGDLLEQLRKIEIKDVKLKIMEKKMEYVDKLNTFKRMLEQQKAQQQSKQPHTESARSKEFLSNKFEKINVMRMLMLNIICGSNINYEENPEYSEMASRLLEPITFQTVQVRLTQQADQ